MLTNDEIRRLLDVAGAGLHRGQVALARQVFDGILEDNPQHAPTLILKAVSYIAVGEYHEADEILNDVLARNDKDEDARAYLGLSAYLAGDKDRARDIVSCITGDSTAARLAHQVQELCC